MSQTAVVIQFPGNSGDDDVQESPKVTADVDNGYTRLANAILDMLCYVELSGRQNRVVHGIIRWTYGYQQKTAYLKAPFLAEAIKYTGDDSNIRTDIRTLKQRKIIVTSGNEIGINPVISEWVLEKNSPSESRNKTSRNLLDSQKNTESKTTRQTSRKQPATESKTTRLPSRKQPAIKENPKENSIKKTKNKGIDLSSLPEWLNKQTVEDFIEHRKQIKKPVTQVAVSRLITKLDGFRQQGHDPNACLDESIANGWQGVFTPKAPPAQANGLNRPMFSRPNRQQALEESNAQAAADFVGGDMPVSDYTEYEAQQSSQGEVLQGELV